MRPLGVHIHPLGVYIHSLFLVSWSVAGVFLRLVGCFMAVESLSGSWSAQVPERPAAVGSRLVPFEIQAPAANLQLHEKPNFYLAKRYIFNFSAQMVISVIFKKGDTNKFENYRPMSLLSTTYNIFAAIPQRRISKILDKHLQSFFKLLNNLNYCFF